VVCAQGVQLGALMITVWTTVFGNYHHFVDEWLDSSKFFNRVNNK
jgi:hypothetical protein